MRLWPLALAVLAGCALLGPPDPARKVTGVWMERLPADGGTTKVVSLWLQPEGRATLETVTLGRNDRPIEHGRWSFRDDNQLTVQLENGAGEPAGQPLVFDLVGDRLIPKRWDHAVYGADGLPLRRRVH